MSRKPAKRFQDMDAAELAEATKEFDEEFVMDKARPMTPVERAEEHRARRKRGRPRIGKGSKKINITIERSLLAEADQLARRQGLNRSQFLARGLETMLRRKAV
jgi:hypothetical protein